jgi:hypothetical protein
MPKLHHQIAYKVIIDYLNEDDMTDDIVTTDMNRYLEPGKLGHGIFGNH